MTDQEAIAAFLAKRGATVCAPAPAYGVDPSADKIARAKAREAARYSHMEQDAERYAERVREAAYVGGRRAAIEEMQGNRCHDYTHYES